MSASHYPGLRPSQPYCGPTDLVLSLRTSFPPLLAHRTSREVADISQAPEEI